MSLAMAMRTVAPAAGTDVVCFHCGEAPTSAPDVVRDAGGRAFCCAGCAAAARWIREARLEDYYHLRSAPAGRIVPETVDLAAWDRDDVQSEHAREVEGGREITLLADGMRCAACAWLIDRALTREPGVVEATANAVTGRIRLIWDPQRTALSAPLRRLAELGYRPYLAGGEKQERARRTERNRDLLRLGVAGLGAMQAMMFAEALYLDTAGEMAAATRDFFRWIAFLVSTPVVFYAGWPFLAGCWRELRHRRLGMDTLVAVSTLLAYGASLVETIRGGPHVWYDAAVMFVFLLLTARTLERQARRVASAQVDTLARSRPALAVRERGGGCETVPVSALAVGDVVRVPAGEAAPADGILLDESGSFAEALLTGEPHPVAKSAGAPVFAGTLCRDRPVRVRVAATGSATRLSQTQRLAEAAQAHRPRIARLADRVAAHFVLGLLVAAAVVYAIWRQHDPSRAFEVALSMLVISCPCALSLSVPAALAAAHGALAKIGMLAVRPDALDALARATDVVFDKTGTLSDGRLALQGVSVYGELTGTEATAIAAALERDSRHPVAAAFAGRATTSAVRVEEHPGLGIEGVCEGRLWRLGRADFAAAREDDGGVWLGDGRIAYARFALGEAERADACDAVAALRAQSLEVRLSSGDAEDAAIRFARRLGICEAASRRSAEDKLADVRALQAQGRVVAMVGDGLNDAPVLAGADVSIAVAEGSALAQYAADLVMTGPTLTRIPAAVALARRTRRIVRQNLAWAVGYNVLALPLAATGLATPSLAALGMAVSSLTVTVNALRLLRGGAA